MTREGQGIEPGETPLRPASTRWAEPETSHDEELLPPFPGGRGSVQDDAAGAVPAEATAPVEPVPSGEEIAGVEATEAVDTAEAVDTVDAVDAGGAVTDADETVVDTAESVAVAEEEPLAAAAAEPEVDLGELEAMLEAAAPAVPGAYETPGAPDAAIKIAERLEELAARLRAEGAPATAADMASSDRLTALLAGLIAGYLAGQEE